MQIYISKNGQRLGPFEEAKVLEMMERGELASSDSAIRQGETQWSKLENLYPNAGNKLNARTPLENAAPKKSRKGLLLGCAGFFLIGILATGVFGFFVYRNMSPDDSQENLPDSVKTSTYGEFKLKTRYPPKGNFWGSEQTFVGVYENETKKSVIYMMTVYADEDTSKKAMQTELADTCKAGEKTMNFSFEENGVELLSKAATCAAPLYVINGKKLVALGGGGGDVDKWIEFAENLPFNKGAKMKRK